MGFDLKKSITINQGAKKLYSHILIKLQDDLPYYPIPGAHFTDSGGGS